MAYTLYINGTTAVSSTGANGFTVDAPASINVGDRLVAYIGVVGNVEDWNAIEPNPSNYLDCPSGWTFAETPGGVGWISIASAEAYLMGFVFAATKVATSSEPSSYTFTLADVPPPDTVVVVLEHYGPCTVDGWIGFQPGTGDVGMQTTSAQVGNIMGWSVLSLEDSSPGNYQPVSGLIARDHVAYTGAPAGQTSLNGWLYIYESEGAPANINMASTPTDPTTTYAAVIGVSLRPAGALISTPQPIHGQMNTTTAGVMYALSWTPTPGNYLLLVSTFGNPLSGWTTLYQSGNYSLYYQIATSATTVAQFSVPSGYHCFIGEFTPFILDGVGDYEIEFAFSSSSYGQQFISIPEMALTSDAPNDLQIVFIVVETQPPGGPGVGPEPAVFNNIGFDGWNPNASGDDQSAAWVYYNTVETSNIPAQQDMLIEGTGTSGYCFNFALHAINPSDIVTVL